MEVSFFRLHRTLLDLYQKVVDPQAAISESAVRAAMLLLMQEAAAPGQLRQSVALVDHYARLIGQRVSLPAAYIGAEIPEEIVTGQGQGGISLVTCCMNRSDNLLRALPSWLKQDQISEIVIVDWSSTRPLAPQLAAAGFSDPRLRVYRVEGETRWILSQAFNVGFRVAHGEKILKLDADICLSEDFFARNPVPENGFLAGNWRNVSPDQTYVNGVFFAQRAALHQTHGFNEFITTYGWDDEDLYHRFKAAGFARRDVDPKTVQHLDHDDGARMGALTAAPLGQNVKAALGKTPRVSIHRNRYLAKHLPYWSPKRALSRFKILSTTSQQVRLEKLSQVAPKISPDLLEHAESFGLRHVLGKLLGPQVLELAAADFSRLLALPEAQVFKHNSGTVLPSFKLNALKAPNISQQRARLFIDAQHGLGNRLRAIGSAAAIATATGRELVIVWEPDAHSACRFEDLFSFTGAVIGQSFLSEAKQQGMATYNYMTLEPGAEKAAEIRAAQGADLYVRSAFVLNHPQTSWRQENGFLQSLTPAKPVVELIQSIAVVPSVAVHIRMQGAEQAQHLSYENAANWTAEDHAAILHGRAQSHYSRFSDRLDSLVAAGRAEQIFLAADQPEAYAVLGDRFGSRLSALHRDVFDRSAAQMRYALADAILLGRAPLLLGSNWSSFTELARRLSSVPAQGVEMSGRDF